MASLDTEVGGMPLAINAGVRFEDTDYTSSGASRTVLSAKPRLDQNGDPTGQNDIVVSDVVPVSFRGKYNDWLPSRSDERRVGNEGGSTCRCGGGPSN